MTEIFYAFFANAIGNNYSYLLGDNMRVINLVQKMYMRQTRGNFSARLFLSYVFGTKIM